MRILVRLSGGELRFEPPDAQSSQAFDLSVWRRDCPEPIAVGNLPAASEFAWRVCRSHFAKVLETQHADSSQLLLTKVFARSIVKAAWR